MIRGTWVYDKDTGELVPKQEYEAKQPRLKRSHLPSPQVMRDITPFRNVAVDGAEITSRSHKREMMKQNGLAEVGNDLKFKPRPRVKMPSVKESLKKALNQLGV